MPQYWDITTDDKFRNFTEHRAAMLLSGKKCMVEIVEGGEITPKQFDAEHVWFRQCAEKLRDAGVDMKMILEGAKAAIPVTETSFKEVCYKPVLKVMSGKDSTTKQNTKEPAEVREVLHRHFAEEHNVQLPEWPTRFNL